MKEKCRGAELEENVLEPTEPEYLNVLTLSHCPTVHHTTVGLCFCPPERHYQSVVVGWGEVQYITIIYNYNTFTSDSDCNIMYFGLDKSPTEYAPTFIELFSVSNHYSWPFVETIV
jgi:hypothetical protein